jgi:hypothetical protein
LPLWVTIKKLLSFKLKLGLIFLEKRGKNKIKNLNVKPYKLYHGLNGTMPNQEEGK